MSVVTENQLFLEEIPEMGAAKGHVRFKLKSKRPEDVALGGFCANIAASLLFERLKAQGTNLIIDLGQEVRIDVLARYEEDGLNLQWTPEQLEPGQFDSAQERIKNKTFFIGKNQEKEEKNAEPTTKILEQNAEKERIPDAPLREQLNEEEEDYLIKQLHRIP